MFRLFLVKSRSKESNLLFLAFIIAHLVTFGCASFFGGFVHQIWPHTEEFPGTPLGYLVFWRLTLMFGSVHCLSDLSKLKNTLALLPVAV